MKSLATLVLACILLAGCNGQGRPKVDEDQVYQDYLVLGPAYMRNGEYQRAKSNLNRPQVFENLGVSFLRLGRADDAEQDFERAVALNPLQPRALIELADLRFSKQDYVNSQSLFTRYIQGFDQTAQSLWLEVRLARIFGAEDEEASYGFVLKNIFPASDQYTRYRESISE